MGHLIGLGEHGGGALDEDVVSGEAGTFFGDIDVANSGDSGLEVLAFDAEGTGGGFEARHGGAEVSAFGGDVIDGVGDHLRGGRHGEIIIEGWRGGLGEENAHGAGLEIAIADFHGLAGFFANGYGEASGVGAEKVISVKGTHGGGDRATADGIAELLLETDEFFLIEGDVAGIFGDVLGESGEFAHPGEDFAHIAHEPVGGLDVRDGALNIADRGFEAGVLGEEFFGNGEAGGVVGGLDDFCARAESIQRSAEHFLVPVEVTSGESRGDVGGDVHRIIGG